MTQAARLAAAGIAALFALGGCQPDESPIMEPGENCQRCHEGGDAPRWTVAGTVFGAPDAPASAGVKDAEVHVVDSTGRAITLRTNSAGNFYTAEKLQPPLTVEVRRSGVRMPMARAAAVGACNSCHRQPPVDDAPGRLFVASQ